MPRIGACASRGAGSAAFTLRLAQGRRLGLGAAASERAQYKIKAMRLSFLALFASFEIANTRERPFAAVWLRCW